MEKGSTIIYIIRSAKQLVLFTMLILQVACIIPAAVRPDDPAYAPKLPITAQLPRTTAGAIYNPGSAHSLFTDNKASRIGDVITIVLSEQTISKKSSAVSIEKDSEVSIAEDANGNTLLGTNPTFNNMSLATSIGGEREFDGGAEADQSNSLSGNISVTVADILPNGNLVVRGEKWITLNRGDEFIRVSGIVRPEDITTDNTVRSYKLANARISYSGRGSLADSQQMGWLSQFFNSPIWPF